MARSNPPISPYTQTGIGDCGHVVITWPQVSELGGRNARVICDECTRAKYDIPTAEQFIWVRLVKKPKAEYEETDPDMPTPKAKRAPTKRKPKGVLAQLLQQEGMF